jgi:hypothetical protein
MENGNNIADGGKKFKAQLRVAEQESRAKDLDIERLTAMLAAAPSTPCRIGESLQNGLC